VPAPNIQSLHDLLTSNLTLAQANPECGGRSEKLIREKLSKAGTGKRFAPRTAGLQAQRHRGSPMTSSSGAVGGGILSGMRWRPQYPELQIVHCPNSNRSRPAVAAAVLTCTRQSTAALRFARLPLSRR